MYLKNSDIYVALSIVLLNILWMLLSYPLLWVSVLLALPMVFLVPGYMLTEILTYKRELDISHRLTLSLGLSLTLDILGGFLLNVLPTGLRTQSWVALLSCLTLVFALTALYLRRGATSQERERQGTMPMGEQGDRKGLPYTSRVKVWVGVCSGMVFAVAVALVIFSLLYAARGVAEQPAPGFTQLWMLPPNPTTQGCAVRVGIRSFEHGPTTYDVVMTVNKRQTMSWPALALAPNQVWEQSITITPTTPKNMFVQVKLYRNDKPTVVYREVHVTLNVLRNGQKMLYCAA